ncbi:hypothetical protein GCK32_021158, partial [Trichostrongylus colubriformis]
VILHRYSAAWSVSKTLLPPSPLSPWVQVYPTLLHRRSRLKMMILLIMRSETLLVLIL